MSQEPDIMFFDRDAAFRTAAELAGHILETANGYHVLTDEMEFAGRDRLRLGLIMLMFEESGKLMTMIQELEKAAKADYQSVRIEELHDNCGNGQRAVRQIHEEVKTVDLASELLGKRTGKRPEPLDPLVPQSDFCALKNAALYYHLREGPDLKVPSDPTLDRYALVMEKNALSAADYVHELARALGLWVKMDLKAVKDNGDRTDRIRYR